MRKSLYLGCGLFCGGWAFWAYAAEMPAEDPTISTTGLAAATDNANLDSRGPPTPPPEAFSACNGRSEGDACSVKFHDQTIEGVCRKMPEGKDELVCVPNHFPPPPGQ